MPGSAGEGEDEFQRRKNLEGERLAPADLRR
jgi:hypothetical protein